MKTRITIQLLIWFLFTINFVRSNFTYFPFLAKDRNITKPTTKSPRIVMSWTPGRESQRLILDGQEVVFRVVNGTAAKLGDVPYQISFRKHVPRHNAYASFCGGALVHVRKILTAAHCFHQHGVCDSCCHSGTAPKNFLETVYAVAGCLKTFTIYVEDSLENGQWRRIEKVTYPKTYYFPRHDIAVAFLYSPYTLNIYVNTIPYAYNDIDYTGMCLLSGFGRTGTYTMSHFLRVAELRLLTKRQCNSLHKEDMHRFICTADDVTDIGKGDSGGPLVCKGTRDSADQGKGILAGIVSGKRIELKHGSFFVRVSEYNEYVYNLMAARSCRMDISNFVILFCLWVGVVAL